MGFYYKAFYKPFGVWRFWEPMIRQMAGLGVANLDNKPPYRDKQYLFCDIAVIGAGPAGLGAKQEGDRVVRRADARGVRARDGVRGVDGGDQVEAEVTPGR